MDALNRHRKSPPALPALPLICRVAEPVLTLLSCLPLTVKSEGGVDCARLQGLDDASNANAGAGLLNMGAVKVDDSAGWPTLSGRPIGALAM